MKTIFYYLVIILSFSSCKAQKNLIKSKGKDIIIFDFKEGNIKSIKNEKHPVTGANTEIYNNDKKIILTQKWLGYGTGHFDKIYSFTKEKDTMNVHCKCGQEKNYYIKNIRFQKGNYKLNFTAFKVTPKVSGHTISTTKEMQNTLFTDTYAFSSKKNNTEFKNISFKKLYFNLIDIKNTLNVTLEKKTKTVRR